MNRENLQREMIVRLFQTSNALQTYMDKLLKKDNITTKQFFMMIILGSFQHSPRIGEVSESFGTSRQNVKQVLLKLEKSGFIEMFKDELDSRITRVRFTEQANHFWEPRYQQDGDSMKRIFEPLEDNDLYGMIESLIKLFDKLEDLKKVM